MDKDSIYSIKNFDKIINKSNLLNNKPDWILYGLNMDSRLIDRIKSKYEDSIIDWQVDDYHVFLIFVELIQEDIDFCSIFNLDYAKYENIPQLDQNGVILFDMDSTAIEIECIDEIAKLAGVGDEVAQVTEKAMRGELDFTQSLKQRVEKLKGVNVELLSELALPLSSGMKKLCKTMQHYGWQVAIASGGFTFFSDQLKQELSLNFAQSNQLEIIDGKLTGRVVGEIVDSQKKADILLKLADKHSVLLSQCIAVGDGANDLPMLNTAGLGIAYHAKPKVQQQAQIAIRHSDLGAVFCILSASLIFS